MKRSLFALCVAVLVAAGCNKPAEDPAAANPSAPGVTGSKVPQGGGGSDTVNPIGPNVGGITPVTGGENLGGTNGGSGAVAKGMAKSAASKASGSSLSQMGGDDNGGGG